jgi:hypothetical protein
MEKLAQVVEVGIGQGFQQALANKQMDVAASA